MMVSFARWLDCWTFQWSVCGLILDQVMEIEQNTFYMWVPAEVVEVSLRQTGILWSSNTLSRYLPLSHFTFPPTIDGIQ